MTVAALPAIVEYFEDGITRTFAVPYRFRAAADLIVERVLGGSAMPLALGVDYTVSGGETDAGGSITRLASANGAALRIRRRTARAQPMIYTTGDRFPAESHEEALDRAALIDQEQDADIGDVRSRALLVPPGEDGGTLPIADLRRETVAVFDLDGRLSVLPAGSFPAGPPGAAENTFKGLGGFAAFKASDTSRGVATLVGVPGIADGRFYWTLGDYTGQADERTIVASTVASLSIGAWVRELADRVYLRSFGADPTGQASSVAAFNRALAAGKIVMGSPGDVYLLDAAVFVPGDRMLIGNGAAIRLATAAIGLRLHNDKCKVKEWAFQGNGGLYAVFNTGKFNEFSGNNCTGDIGHYFFSSGAEHVRAVDNNVDGLTASVEITTAIVCENSKHITIRGNHFFNVTVGWSIQLRASENFSISANTFFQQQFSDTKIAVAGQTVFSFTFAQPCFLKKIQVNGRPLSPGPGPAYTVTGAGPVYTVTFANPRAAGEAIKLIGYRGAENIQINNGSKHGTVAQNTIDGTADSGIILLGADVSVSGNAVRNCGYAGIAIYGDQDGISVTGNTIIDCAQMDDGLSSPDFPNLSSPFAGAILASGSAATITGNIIRNFANTMRYAIMVNKTDMTLRTDGTPTIDIARNIADGVYADGKISLPNQNPGQRLNSVMVDGPTIFYPQQLDFDDDWVEFPAGSGRYQPADSRYFTVGGSANTRAVRDTATTYAGVASLRTVPGEHIDFTLRRAAMLFNSVVTVSFWAKANGGGSLVEAITTLDGLNTPLGALITDTNWRPYAFSFAFTPKLEKALVIRCSANPGSSANIEDLQISARRL